MIGFYTGVDYTLTNGTFDKHVVSTFGTLTIDNVRLLVSGQPVIHENDYTIISFQEISDSYLAFSIQRIVDSTRHVVAYPNFGDWSATNRVAADVGAGRVIPKTPLFFHYGVYGMTYVPSSGGYSDGDIMDFNIFNPWEIIDILGTVSIGKHTTTSYKTTNKYGSSN